MVKNTDDFSNKVATALNNEVFEAKIAKLLATSYADQLRGPQGAPGKDGKDGASPNATDVAQVLAISYADQLRDPQGAPGKDGKDGASPSVEDVATDLINKHSAQLRQILTPRSVPRARRTSG